MPSHSPPRSLCLPLLLAVLAPGATAQQGGAKRWSLQPVVRPPVPEVRDPAWPTNPIDHFVLARLEARKLRPSPPADRTTLVRRMSLVIRGLPAAPAQLEDFVADRRPDAFDRLLGAMLSSPRYGERWASHWLDVVGFAETNGFETNTPRNNAFVYRDWVIDALNRDLPYHRFVLEQLAGDAVGADAATGFLVAGPYDTVKSPDVVLTRTQRQDELADMVERTSGAFLGLTVACARCHDHKFDPIPQRDFYALAAVFAGVRHGERGLRPPDHAERTARAKSIENKITALERDLASLPISPSPPTDGLLRRDDRPVRNGVEVLRKPRGHGTNPAGAARGRRDDRGDLERGPNISGGSYTWWSQVPGQDLITYAPGPAGRYRIWLSWGCGFETHTTAARYLIDRDGDLATTSDQSTLATIDQQRFAGRDQRPGAAGRPRRTLPNQPLWSGLHDAGVHELNADSRVVLRAGPTDRPVTADVVVFESVTAGGTRAGVPRLRPAVTPARNEERFDRIGARFVRFTVWATNNGTEPCLDELEIFAAEGGRNVARAAIRRASSGDYLGDPKHRLAHVHDGRRGNAHSWISNTRGRGHVELELADTVEIDRIVWGRDGTGRFTDRVPTGYRIEVARERGAWQEVASSQTRVPFGVDVERAPAYRFAGLSREQARVAEQKFREVEEARARVAALRAQRRAWIGRFEKPAPTHRLHRGNPMAAREVVAPAALTALDAGLGIEDAAPEQERRLALARWITAPDHPLTARVIVNRIWQHHFGEGLVDTPSDFGAMGSPPSHPQLLDWLASELIENGWSIKHVQRLILRSSTWRQSSRPRPAALAIDAQSRLLWRFPPRRLAAETIRDAVLAVAGSLDLETVGGPGFEVFEPDANYVRVYRPKRAFGSAEWRRAIYMRKVRMEQDATFGPFDAPDAGQGCAKRTRSITPLQALSLLNSPFVVQQADRFANRIRREAGRSPAAAVQRAFLLAFGRAPARAELQAGITLVRAHGLAALCRALLNANEFLFLA